MAKATRTILEFDKQSVEAFNQLKKILVGEKGELSNKEAFLIAMAWGAHHRIKAESITKSGTGARVEYLSDADNALFAAAHYIDSPQADTLLDINAIHTTAELYAEAGIRLLAEEMKKPGDFAERFRAFVFELVEENPG